MSIKQAIEALEVAQDALDISQSLQESAKSNHHPKTLAAYERVSAALAALRSMPEPVANSRPLNEYLAERIATMTPEQLAAFEAARVRIKAAIATPHTEAVRMSEAWISVDERLPEPFTDVLISPRPTYYCCEGQVDHKGQWTYSEYEAHFGNVTHKIQPRYWMPLPPPPVEQATAARLGVKMGDV